MTVTQAAIRCLEVVMQHHTTQVDLEVRTDSIYVVKGSRPGV